MPLGKIVKSPAQLDMSWWLKSSLPTSKHMLHPNWHCKGTHGMPVYIKKYYDQHAGKSPNDCLWVQVNDETWTQTTIAKKAPQMRTYIMETPAGNKFRRNQRHIWPSKEDEHHFQPETTPMPWKTI